MRNFKGKYLPAPNHQNKASSMIISVPHGKWSVGTVGSGYLSESESPNKESFTLRCTDPDSCTWSINWESDKSRGELHFVYPEMEKGDIFVHVSIDASEEYEYEIE